MSHTIYVGKIAKRKNSTLQPTLSTTFDVLLKSPTSLHTPTFTINSASFDYNYLKWNDRYYFVTDVVSKNNSLWEVSARCDVLATFKADILASTQFVSYSSLSGGTWLADTRIPVLKSETTARAVVTMPPLSHSGFYVLSVVGKAGCELWACTINEIRALLQAITTWSSDLADDILAGNYPWSSSPAATYSWNTPEEALESFSKMNMLTGIAGNAYADAPNCIRSCIWVPFIPNDFSNGTGEISLGQFMTGVTATKCKMSPKVGFISVSIPWQYNDWRRTTCEEIYLYIPLIGMVAVPSDEIANESTLTLTYSVTATDGTIAVRVDAGNQIIGTYGASCCSNYPIGISQQASAGEVVQTALNGIESSVSAGILSVPIAGLISTAYDTIDTALSHHNSCIGGIGGGSGAGMSFDLVCYSVAHPTSVSPSDMTATMGVPTMKPSALANLTGYCQCANAHVAASGAEGPELDELDAFLNNGFYIE